MVLCGVVDDLEYAGVGEHTVSYFFCQAGDPRIINASAVLKGLISLLIEQRPFLASHVQNEYDRSGKGVLEVSMPGSPCVRLQVRFQV